VATKLLLSLQKSFLSISRRTKTVWSCGFSFENIGGSFNTLIFGKNKPLIGSCHDGRLDLIYYRDPGLEEGQSSLCGRFNNRVSDCALEALAQRRIDHFMALGDVFVIPVTTLPTIHPYDPPCP
jgi:hypothetical protein